VSTPYRSRSLRRLAPVASTRARRRGLTLVEVLISIALAAVLTGAIVFGSGMFSSSRERAAATLIVTGVRIGLTRANGSGKPTRMVFDLDKNRVLLEEASSSVMLREKEEGESTGGGAEAANLVEKKAREDAERILEGPRAPRPRFKPIKQIGFNDESAEGRELGKGIEFRQVQTDHDGEPRKEGRAYLYFWPGGVTERAVVQLKRSDGGEGLSIVVSPLTGRAKIQKGRVELPEPPADGEISEREE
jgi:general secretion pathway protein H